MDDILSAIDSWYFQDQSVALATVVSTWGSSPRGVGAKMVINSDGEMAGSVSGGCVESAVIEVGMNVCTTGKSVLLHYSVSNDQALDVGLACGGEIYVFVQPLDKGIFSSIRSAWEKGFPGVRAFIIQGADEILGRELFLSDGGGHFPSALRDYVVDLELMARETLNRGASRRDGFVGPDGERIDAFFDFIKPADTIVIIGGVHIAIHLVAFARELGYKTIVIDPRKKFLSKERFPNVDKVYQSWPKIALSEIKLTSTSAVVILTHDSKIDDQALEMVLKSPVFYIGALGSRKTHSERQKRLSDIGFNGTDIDRIKSPIGIKIDSQSPAEIALAIMAEIILMKNSIDTKIFHE